VFDLLQMAIHAELMRAGGHDNVVRLVESFEDAKLIYFVLEYCEEDAIISFIQKETFTEDLAKQCFRQLLKGVSYMHRLGIVHGDLSPETIQMDAKQVLKVGDFFFACHAKPGVRLRIQANGHGPGMTRYMYMSPEVFGADEYDPYANDVWSLGVILVVMLLGTFAFSRPTMVSRCVFNNSQCCPHNAS
jgi:serine/threonine protein kinase